MALVASKRGSGPAKVLLLHGWFGPGVYRESLLDAISVDDRFEYAVLHNPGYCDHKGAAELPADITALARAHLAAADELGWDEFHLIGHSYGGVAALRIATLAPGRVLSIVGLNPVMPSGFDAVAAANIGADETTAPKLLGAREAGREAVTAVVRGFDSEMGDADAGVLVDCVFDDMTEDAYRNYFGVWTGASFVDDVRGLETRALFVVGEQDAALDLKYCRPTLDAMPNAEAALVRGGHFVPFSNADGAMVAAINKFYAA